MEQPILRAKNMRVAVMSREDVAVPRARLAELERKEKAHDSYLRATHHMRTTRPGLAALDTGFGRGWRACLNEFSQAVIDAGRE